MLSDDKPKLLLCGTGLRIGQMTLETFHALKTCERIFCVNLPEAVFAQMQEAFTNVEDATAAYKHGQGLADDVLVNRVAASWNGRTSLAVVVMGHPLLYSIVPKLVRHCRGHGVDYRILAGLSTADVVLSVVEPYITDPEHSLHGAGLVVQSAPDLVKLDTKLDPEKSSIVLNLFRLREQSKGDSSVWKRFAAIISIGYAPDHPIALVECASGGAGSDRVVQSRVADLEGLEGHVNSHTSLFIPMKPRLGVMM